MVTYAPLALIFGFFSVLTVGAILYWKVLADGLAAVLESYASQLERAAIPVKREDVARNAAIVIVLVVVIWGSYVFVEHPSLLFSMLALAIIIGLVYFGVRAWIARRIAKRLNDFNNQLELIIRLVVSALRVGLGLRQAIAMVVSEMPSPASVEFTRVLMQTTIGVSMDDALEQLTKRMPSTELTMMVKSIKIQSQTGGNLAKILVNLSEMIKQRRRITRRIASLTSESQSTKYIITALPVGMTLFILVFNPPMRDALLGTLPGRGVMFFAAGMLTVGWIIYDKIAKLDI